MEQNKNTLVQEHYSNRSLFDIKVTSILEGLDLASCKSSAATGNMIEVETKRQMESISSSSISSDVMTKLVISETKFCHSCQAQFVDREEQVLHYKSDWHRYNLHLRVRGAPSVTEDQFETMSGDVSSISGSDSEEEVEEQNGDTTELDNPNPLPENELAEASPARPRESQKVYFTNNDGDLISVYRCLLHHKKNPIYETDELISAVAELPKKLKWAILMVTCGHFAGAIFNGNDVLEHKTFHRYTVRKKRGTAQSSHDNKGRQAKSAGAHLRRYNEAALAQEVQELLSKWQDHLDSCHFVFVRIPVANRGMFFSGKNAPMKKDDLRIRIIPFPTRRPTFNELKRVQQTLSAVETYGKAANVGTTYPRSPRRFFNKDSGLLEVTQPTEKQTAKVKSRPGSARSKPQASSEAPAQIVPVKEQESEEEKEPLDLVQTTEEVNFSDLKEFDCVPKKKRNKVKEKDINSKIEDFSLDEREIRWKNSLFTASKTGNENIFKIIVNEMIDHHKEVLKSPLSCEYKESNEPQPCSEGDKSSQPQLNPDRTPAPCQSIETSPLGAACCSSQQNLTTGGVPTSAEAISLTGSSNQQPNVTMERVADFLNKPLGDGGQTFLHVASRENQAALIHLLLEHGADPALKEKTGKTPYNLGGSDARSSFRRFMSLWPDKYDYATAQVPSPLTEEMEAERKRKMAEKRKAKKKAANERNKEKKETLAKEREEEKEKERYLALSDREKRALAAERRILQQHSTDNSSVKPVLSRCWECAIDISGKVPFEYSDYKFCSTKCLRAHRSKQK